MDMAAQILGPGMQDQGVWRQLSCPV
jgi:hypothetical protein